jgi:hypothetical protein
MRTLAMLVATCLACMPSPFNATAQSTSECPDTRGTQVDARTTDSGSRRCGFGFRIFGIGGGLFGPECPIRTVHYPSHQVCNGEESRGTYCLPAGNLPVEVEECDCDSATVFGTGVLFPSCTCTEGNAGHVEDAQTYPCPIIVIGDAFEFP